MTTKVDCIKTQTLPQHEDGVLVCGPGQHGVWPTKCSGRCHLYLQQPGVMDGIWATRESRH